MRALACVLGVLTLWLGLPAGAQSDPSAWGESAMVKVRPQSPPGSASSVHLVAARNEFISFQVGLHGGETGWSGVSASLPVLVGPGRIEGAELVLYREMLIPITRTSEPYTEPGEWPDGLIPDVDETMGERRNAFPMDVPAHESRALWVDIHVPLDAPPGEYEGVLEVSGGGYDARVSVSLTVVDGELPSTSSLRTYIPLFAPSVCKAFTGQRECAPEVRLRLLSDFHRLGLEHRITLASRFDAQDVPDWATFDAWWGPFLKGTASLRLPGARMTSVLYLGAPAPEQLTDFVTQIRARGLLPLAFNFVADEPPYFSTFDEVRTFATLSRQVVPELRTVLTSNFEDLERHKLADLIDILVVGVNFLHYPEESLAGAPSSRSASFLSLPERELWVYQGCMSHGCGGVSPMNVPGQGWPSYVVDCPATKARAMEWVSFLVGATGEHYYEVAMMLSTAWTDQYSYGGNGDGTLFYPGTVDVIGGTTDVPLPSMRLKLIRLGLQDYEWLKMVSDAGDPEFAREVARELIPAPWRVPDNGQAFERARLRLIRRYLQLVGAEVPAVLDSVEPDPSERPGGPSIHLPRPERSAR